MKEWAEISLSTSSLVDTQSNDLSIELSMARKRNICHNGKVTLIVTAHHKNKLVGCAYHMEE